MRDERARRGDVHGAEIDRHAVEAAVAHAVEPLVDRALGHAGRRISVAHSD